jgi:hypothetical protein
MFTQLLTVSTQTSNGIGLFDEAVMSRVHLSIPYERPTPEQRELIWISIFSKLARDQEAKNGNLHKPTTSSPIKDPDITQEGYEPGGPFIVVDESAKAMAYRDFKGLELNGRDIRNSKPKDSILKLLNWLVVVVLTAVDLARLDAYKNLPDGKKLLEKIVVGCKHLSDVVENKKKFREDYKRATGLYPEELAAEHYHRNDRKDE